jgi:predicted TIM-barrel fold metal-dependent hydrolase
MPPTIDVHTHIFSALDIPIEGYLLSRRSETRLGRYLDPVLSVFPMPQLFTYVASRARERCVTRRLDEDAKRGWFYTFLLWTYGKLALQRFLDWEDSLTSRSEVNGKLLLEIWPEVDLFVPLMIDYEYWFKNSLDNGIGGQIDTVFENVILPHKGRIHPFVPFDPARELAYRKARISPDGQLEADRPMTLVKESIEEKGFIGVKLYNSLGYRPLGNADARVSLMRRRIAVRNNKMTYLFEGDEYDEVLRELYDYCVDNEVPITAHCVMNGIEAYPGASFDFGQAKFWDEVLRQERYKNLHLNLAHFGWNQEPGQGYAGSESWAKDVCDLIVRYDNVYADVSHHRVLTRKGRKSFVDGYRQMRRDYSNDIEKIKKRMLYGSDWHVLRRIRGYERFFEDYGRVLTEAEFFAEDELGDFRGGNALEFLGLLPGAKNHARLESFYRAHGTVPPAWFGAADHQFESTEEVKHADRKTKETAALFETMYQGDEVHDRPGSGSQCRYQPASVQED